MLCSASVRHSFAPTVALALVLWTISVAVWASPGDSITDEQQRAVCAAANAIVGNKTEGFAGEVIIQEARRVSQGIGAETIEGALRMIQVAINSGELTWDELVGLAEQCVSIY